MIIGISGKIGSGKDTVGKIIQYLTMRKLNEANNQSFEEFCTWFKVHEHSVVGYDHWQIKKFAFAVKQVCSILTGIPIEDFEKEEVKNSNLPNEWNIESIIQSFNGSPEQWFHFTEKHREDKSFRIVSESPVRTGDNEYRYKYIATKQLTIRELLQKVGTDAIRNVIHPDTWVIALMNQYKPTGDYPIIEGDQYVKDGFIYPNWIITDVRFPNEFDAIQERDGIVIRVKRDVKWIDPKEYENLTGKTVPHVEPHPSETALNRHQFDYVIDNNGSIEELIEQVKFVLADEKLL